MNLWPPRRERRRTEHRRRGATSHRHFKHATKPGLVTVAFHNANADIPIGTLKSLLKRAGLE